VIGSLLALAGLALYWEWRYRVEGWGRGWMRNAADRPKHARYGWFSSLEDMVWGPPPKVPEPWDEDTIRVSVRWDIDVPLPERSPES
jgi:hypothetical protein